MAENKRHRTNGEKPPGKTQVATHEVLPRRPVRTKLKKPTASWPSSITRIEPKERTRNLKSLTKPTKFYPTPKNAETTISLAAPRVSVALARAGVAFVAQPLILTICL